MMWGVVVEKLMMMWGQGEDDTKGRVSLTTTYIFASVSLKKLYISGITIAWARNW